MIEMIDTQAEPQLDREQGPSIKAQPPLRDWLSQSTGKRIVTGHQPVFYHPGILSKYIAAQKLSENQPVDNWVVDQDVLDPYEWPLPIKSIQPSADGDGLYLSRQVESLVKETAHHRDMMIPTCMQPPVDLSQLSAAIEQRIETHDLPGLLTFKEAILGVAGTSPSTLAEQVVLLRDAMLRLTGALVPIRHHFASAIFDDQGAQAVLDQLLVEPEPATRTYLAALAGVKGLHGIAPLIHTQQRMELPIWALSWMKPRTRVYACQREGGFDYEVNGQKLSLDELKKTFKLVPRALFFTGLIRHLKSDVFIHGLGGGIYDQATEKWFTDWLGEQGRLAEKRVISCDLHLDAASLNINGPIPLLDEKRYQQILWRKHHVPHNLDREMLSEKAFSLTADQRQRLQTFQTEKRRLLDAMTANSNKSFRADAFKQIHQLNDQMQAMFPSVLANLKHEAKHARTALENDRVLKQRDWPFFIYDVALLAKMERHISAHMTASEKA